MYFYTIIIIIVIIIIVKRIETSFYAFNKNLIIIFFHLAKRE